jgi:transcriptional regulator with XRE-family HTH domain
MGANNGNGTVRTAYVEALESLGEKILLSRRRLSLTQEELAIACNDRKKTSLTQMRVSDIENGKTEATWLEVQAIADVFSKDLNEFRV